MSFGAAGKPHIKTVRVAEKMPVLLVDSMIAHRAGVLKNNQP